MSTFYNELSLAFYQRLFLARSAQCWSQMGGQIAPSSPGKEKLNKRLQFIQKIFKSDHNAGFEKATET